MRVVLQRVKHASVQVDGAVIGEIGQGFLILLGVSDRDDEKTADQMADKICRLRIFEDENGKTNRSLADVGGSVLVVSQFTLYADCRGPVLPRRQSGCTSILRSAARPMWSMWSTGNSAPI